MFSFLQLKLVRNVFVCGGVCMRELAFNIDKWT